MLSKGRTFKQNTRDPSGQTGKLTQAINAAFHADKS
jgi:hypothetical protein